MIGSVTEPEIASATSMNSSSTTPSIDAIDLGSFACPRCQATSSAEFYGPCENCRAELQATQGNEARDVEAAAFEPKMNVTPNAVALKE